MQLSEIEKNYNEYYCNLSTMNMDIYDKLQSYNYSLAKNEISESITNRMLSFWKTHDEIKNFLNKNQKQSSSDFFVECCLFFLRSYFSSVKTEWEIKSEFPIWKEKRKSIRPDITIWNKNNLLAIIEVKVQLGRTRATWKDDLVQREIKLKSLFPDVYFAVICHDECNWKPGFERNSDFGTKYFTLRDMNWNPTNSNFEMLLKSILENVKS